MSVYRMKSRPLSHGILLQPHEQARQRFLLSRQRQGSRMSSKVRCYYFTWPYNNIYICPFLLRVTVVFNLFSKVSVA